MDANMEFAGSSMVVRILFLCFKLRSRSGGDDFANRLRTISPIPIPVRLSASSTRALIALGGTSDFFSNFRDALITFVFVLPPSWGSFTSRGSQGNTS